MSADLCRLLCRWACLVLLALPLPARAQGFAALGTDAQDFVVPDTAATLAFPADHGPHPDFRIEWWYLTANLTGLDGRAYGIQWTLFRSALRPEPGPVATGWISPQIWMAHAALTTPDAHYVAERLSRGGIGTAGATAEPFSAWIDDWHMTGLPTTQGDALDRLDLAASGAQFRYDLRLTTKGPLVAHGDNGYSVKSPDGRASHYYSQPHYTVTGTIETPEGPQEVSGTAWLDREWSSQPLAEDQAGWDWVALTLDSGDRLMAAQLRDGADGYRIGTWIDARGQATPLPSDAITLTSGAVTDIGPAVLPLTWRIAVPDKGVDVEITALYPGAWMATSTAYWEGPVTVTGSHGGRGYLEMTGYDAPAEN